MSWAVDGGGGRTSHTTLISPHDLALRLYRPDWLIVDCRADLTDRSAGQRLYRNGHVPGARFAWLEGVLAGAPRDREHRFRGRHPLPDRDAFVETLRNWGVSNGSQVVAYDAHGSVFAARLWWLLRWVGHEAVLQGQPASGRPLQARGPVAGRAFVVDRHAGDDDRDLRLGRRGVPAAAGDGSGAASWRRAVPRVVERVVRRSGPAGGDYADS